MVSLLLQVSISENVSAYSASITTSGEVVIDVAAPSNVGSMGASMGTDNVVVQSTCPLGYTLSIVGPVDDTLYLGGDSENNDADEKILASAGTVSEPASIIGDNRGTWGYSVASDTTTSSGFVGLTNTAVPLVTTNTASADGGDTIPVYYGASIMVTTKPGTYTLAESSTGAHDNVVTYYLTNDVACMDYNIKYNDNGANSSTTMSLTHSAVTLGSTVTLAASNYQKAGYGFAGWSTEPLDPDSATFQADLATAVAAGNVYGPNEDVAIDLDFLGNAVIEDGQYNIYMYAVWIKPEVGVALQNWDGCSSMVVGDVIALADNRDSNVYAISKLVDGNCWMIENLRLDNSAVLSATNTHNPNLPIVNDYANNITSNSLSANSVVPDGWCRDETDACIDQSRVSTDNTVLSSDANSTSANIYSYGNYYNWYSATAGQGHNGIGYNNGIGYGVVVPGDICPLGWNLPTGREIGQFSYLETAIRNGDDTMTEAEVSGFLRSYPTNYVFGGRINGNSIGNRGVKGYYWSSTSHYDASAYYTDFGMDSNWMGTDSYFMFTGRSVRCIFSTPYTVVFDANGGSGSMNGQSIKVNETATLIPNAFTRAGYAFTGWNTRANGRGVDYADEDEVISLTTGGATIILYAQWEALCQAPGKMCYDDNGANSVTTMHRSTIAATATTYGFRASNFQRAGYGFAGWSLERLNPDAENFAARLASAVADGIVYGPNEVMTFEEGDFEADGKTAYAVWVPSAGDLQGWEGCSDMSIGQVTALTDTRDNNTYAVAKLVDGNCWMIENLRLDDSVELTALDTNNPSLPLVNDYANSVTSNHLSASQDPTVTAWCNTLGAECFDQSMLNTDNTANTVAEAASDADSIFGYGNYYNWYSATAGNGLYSVGVDGVASGDICPAGWHLPFGGDNTNDLSGSFSYLDVMLGGTGSASSDDAGRLMFAKWIDYPNNFIMPGEIEETDYHSRGYKGSYWSANARDADFAYYLSFGNTYVYPKHHSDEKSYGRSVRCVVVPE